MKTGFLITARLKSTRLPEKLLREVEGKPIFSHMIDRLKLTKSAEEIIVCTSTNPQDDRLESMAVAEGVLCFRGDEDDVMKRLSDAAEHFKLDYILSITADCPFSDPEYADKIVELYKETQADLIRALSLPHGAFSYGVRPEAFRRAIELKDDENTEVWTRYFTDTGLFKVVDLPIDNPRHRQPQLRMTLDYPEDLEFFKAVFSQLYKPGTVFTLDEIIDLLESHPEIVELNAHCATAFKKRWTKQSSIKLKNRFAVKSAAVIGCGSIGQRHLRNLHILGIRDLYVLRSGMRNDVEFHPEFDVIETSSWDELFAKTPDVAVITNPTSLHLETIKHCLPHVRGVFVEKPLSHSLDQIPELLTEISERGVTSFVGYNLQFHSVVKHVNEFVTRDDVGKPLLFQCQVGQWIEDWHPGRNYKQAYYARRDLGGGALLSLIHEVHMATELFGPARQVSCVLPQSDLLSLDVDVIADLMIEHANGGVSQIHVDLIQKPAHRQGVVSCERGWINYDLINRTVDSINSASTLTVAEDSAEQSYIEEMKTFLDFARQGKIRHEYDAWGATQSLGVVVSAFSAAASNKVVNLPEWIVNLK